MSMKTEVQKENKDLHEQLEQKYPPGQRHSLGCADRPRTVQVPEGTPNVDVQYDYLLTSFDLERKHESYPGNNLCLELITNIPKDHPLLKGMSLGSKLYSPELEELFFNLKLCVDQQPPDLRPRMGYGLLAADLSPLHLTQYIRARKVKEGKDKGKLIDATRFLLKTRALQETVMNLRKQCDWALDRKNHNHTCFSILVDPWSMDLSAAYEEEPKDVTAEYQAWLAEKLAKINAIIGE
jgi:hypothetical protein